MKNLKRKLLVAFFATTAAVCGAFGLSACGGGKGDDKNSGNSWGSEYSVQSAYVVAQDLGYSGTLDDFIKSISGKDGTDGKDGVGITNTLLNNKGELIIVLSNGSTQNLGKVVGADGTNGNDGVSAFEIYKKYHPEYNGTEQEWIESLKGTDGVDGNDGVGVKTAYINADGCLIIELTNDRTVNCGNIYGNEQLQYVAIKEDNEIVGYSVIGIGSVTDSDVVIPSTYRGKPVTVINANAFKQNDYLTSVIIPDNVKSIGSYAFASCKGLTKLTIGNGIKSIGQCAFNGCSNLSEVVIGTDVTTINDQAFFGCSSLININIPENVTSIGRYVFGNCSSLTSIKIPDSVTSIGLNAFNGCSSLTSIEVDKNNVHYSNQDGILYNKDKTSILHIPTAISGSVTIPDTVGYLVNEVFAGCSNLISINLGTGISSIDEHAFSGCSSLKSITIPEQVTSIGQSAFMGCSSLKSITICNSEINIQSYAFEGCDSLTDITFNGTKDAWVGIMYGGSATGRPIIDNAGKYTVHCMDGETIW